MEEKDKKIYLFEQMPIPKAVATLAIPTILSSLVMVLYNLADTYFVGMLDDPLQNAAVTLAAPVLLAFNAVNNLFGVGASSMMSRALGAKDYQKVKRSAASGFYYALICGILFSVVFTACKDGFLVLLGANESTSGITGEYLKWTVCFGAAPAILNVVIAYLVRAEGSALHASIGTMSGCLLNMILDPIFILPQGLGLGAAGAGLATFLSNCVACIYFFILLFVKRKRTFVSLNPRHAKPSKHILLGICAVGIPASIQNLLNVTGMTVLNNMTAAYNDNAVAAMGISQKISMIPLQIAFGFSQGIMPLISYNYASKNAERMKKGFWFTAKISITFMVTVSALLCIFSEQALQIFMKNPQVVSYGAVFMRGFAMALPFLGTDFLGVGVFQACGMGKKSFVFALMRKIILEIPALLILDRLFPMYGLAFAQLTAELVLAIAAIVVLRGLFRRVTLVAAPK